MNSIDEPSPPVRGSGKKTISQEFKEFFLRGLAALLPTLVTLFLLIWVWSFLWDYLGAHIIALILWLWPQSLLAEQLPADAWQTRLFGVLLSVFLIYIVGFFVGNLIGRTFWKVIETLLMKVPVVRAIYPAVKQVTDFLLSDRREPFRGSRVVAVQPHANDIWSVGLVTGSGLKDMDTAIGRELVMVFLPNSPAAFSGYVVVVPRENIVELPITVEEAMRLLVSGGVIIPTRDATKGNLATTIKQPPGSIP